MILLDENVPLEVLYALKKEGLQGLPVDHVILRDLRGKSDAEIVQALGPDDFFVTFDHDFLTQRFQTEAPVLVIRNPGIIRPQQEWKRWMDGIRGWVYQMTRQVPQTQRPPVCELTKTGQMKQYWVKQS